MNNFYVDTCLLEYELVTVCRCDDNLKNKVKSVDTGSYIYRNSITLKISFFSKKMVNQIENLPNELFAEIMRYLTAVDAIYAFVKLNKRFERLTFRFCRFINLESVDKTKIDFIFQNHDSNQWLSLRISDNNEISSSLNYIFENESIVNRFSQLQSLSLLRMETLFEKNISIYLRNLISLEINPVCGQNLINLYLPQLKTLTLSSCRHTNWIKVKLRC